MIFIQIILCRRYDQSQDYDNDRDKIGIEKRKNSEQTNSFKYIDRINTDLHNNKLSQKELDEFKRIRTLDHMLWSIIKEVFIYVTFLIVLYVVSFSNVSTSSYTYYKLFLSTFVQSQSQNEIGLYDVNIKMSSIIHYNKILNFLKCTKYRFKQLMIFGRGQLIN